MAGLSPAGSFYTGITMDDYGLAMYNAEGLNVLSKHLYCPKLIGSVTFRQRQVLRRPGGDLTVVAADGREIGMGDRSLNVTLDALRGRGIQRFMRDAGRGRRPFRDAGGDMVTDRTYRYEFSLYGAGGPATVGLLPAVIHGWGSGYDGDKFDKAERLVWSVFSGQDIQLASLLGKAPRGENDPQFPQYQLSEFRPGTGKDSVCTGLPVTMTFRSTILDKNNITSPTDGFGLVSCAGGWLYVEMTANTELTVHFYDLAGVPWEYFAQCSTVEPPPSYGLVAYRYEPMPIKYVMTAEERSDMFGHSHRGAPLEMGNIPRAQYVAMPARTKPTLWHLMQQVKTDDPTARRQLSELFEGDPDKPLRYEVFNNARPYLRLLSNSEETRKGQAITVEGVPGTNGCIYTITGGHDYRQVCNPLAHGSAGQFKLPGGGLMNAVGGAGSHSMLERSFSNAPLRVNAPRVPDDYRGAPWNPTVSLRMSDAYKAMGWDYYAPQYNMSRDEMLGSPRVLDRVGDWVFRNTWNLQRVANVLFKRDPVTMTIPNPDYSPDEAMKRQQARQRYREAFNEAESQREFETWGGWDVEAQKEIQQEVSARLKWLELIDEVLDSTEEDLADIFPFWANHGYRHSDDRLEVYKYVSLKHNSNVYNPPEYVPENWILCRLPV